MSLTAEQILQIHNVIALHGHLADIADFDAFGAVFTDDVVYDMEALNGGTLIGLHRLAEASNAMAGRHPAGHLVTNTLVTETGTEVRARSKYLAVMQDGTTGTGIYEDVLEETAEGWRITHRTILPPTAKLKP